MSRERRDARLGCICSQYLVLRHQVMHCLVELEYSLCALVGRGGARRVVVKGRGLAESSGAAADASADTARSCRRSICIDGRGEEEGLHPDLHGLRESIGDDI